ncbi:MAG: AAA domain-containing protein, partial [Acidimicrobiia bacterium]
DDKQTTPENVGVDQQAYFDLLDEHLASIPSYKTLFNIDTSLYELAMQKLSNPVMLTEHFRCLPPIIGFCNDRFYDGKIIPLRDRAPQPGWKALRTIHVPSGFKRGLENPPEAEAVVDLVERICGDPAYDGMDIGVVSLVGSTQSKSIWEQLYQRVGPEVMEARRIRCGEPPNFQGDERDVMIVSTVAAIDPSRQSSRVGAMSGRNPERRMNVAVSRARQQLWVVHSLEPEQFPNNDLRADLIRYCRNGHGANEQLVALEDRCDSQFERDVLGRILGRGFERVHAQYVVGRYRLDLVVEGAEGRLAIECDGDRWHGDDRWHQDRARQEVLERAGWQFQRIRGSAFYRDPDAALEPLWDRLQALGIRPHDATIDVVPPEAPAAPTDATPADEQTANDGQPLPSAHASPPMALPAHLGLRSVSPTSRRCGPSVDLVPYRAFAGRLIAVAKADMTDLADGLTAILEVEGPALARWAVETYLRCAGGAPPSRIARQSFNRSIHRAIQRGRIRVIDDDLPGSMQKTLYLPGTPPAVLRELGPRAVTDVPLSELATLIAAMRLDGSSAQVAAAVLRKLGVTNMLTPVRDHIEASRTYRWSV